MHRVDRVVANHAGGAGAVLRLAEKHIELRLLEPLRRAVRGGHLVVTEEVWSPDQLARLWPVHDRAEPHTDDGALVVLMVGGCEILVDGNNRLNRRRRDGRSHAVLKIEVCDDEIH